MNLTKPTLADGVDPVTQIADNMQKIDDGVALLGHGHTGAAGDGQQIQASGLADGAVMDAKIGNRTLNQSLASPANSGPLTSLLSWLAGRIKAITGKANWYDNPATSLEAAKAHMDSKANPHQVTYDQTGAAPASHTHPWADVSGKPTTFPPSSHQHPWSEVTGKPTTFTPTAHQHAGSDITSAVPDSSKLGGVSASSYSRKDQDETRNANLTMAAGKVITLSGDPTQAMHASTKQYVDAQVAARWREEAGFGVATGLAVSPGSGMTLSVAAGRCYLDNGTRKVFATATNVTLSAASTANPRKDVIYIDNAGAVQVVAGTPATSPAEPTIPANAIKLAVVTVPKSASSIIASNIADARRFIVGMVNGRMVLPVGTDLWAN